MLLAVLIPLRGIAGLREEGRRLIKEILSLTKD